MSQAADTEALVADLELSLLQPAVRQSASVAKLLADDFVEFGSSGRVFDKAQVIAAIQSAQPSAVRASALKVRLLTPQLALVTYRAHRHTQPPVHTWRSSLWREAAGRWQMFFHQGTVAPPPG